MNRSMILDYIKAHKRFFKKEFKVKKIGLFGSFARDEEDDNSDIDIVVELEKPDMFYLIGIKQTLEEKFNKKVDVVRIRDKMNEVLKDKIMREVIYV